MRTHNSLVRDCMGRHRNHVARLMGKRPVNGIGVIDTSILRSATKHLVRGDSGLFAVDELWALEGAVKRNILHSLDDGFSAPFGVQNEYGKHHERLKNQVGPFEALKYWWNDEMPYHAIEVKNEPRGNRESAQKELTNFIERGRQVRDILRVRPTESYWGRHGEHHPAVHAAITSIAPHPIERHSQDVSHFASAVVAGYTAPVAYITADKGFFELHRKLYENLGKLAKKFGFPLINHPISIVYNSTGRPRVQNPICDLAA